MSATGLRRPLAGAGSRLPRALHPAAWWLWALGLGTAATRTRNPLLLLLLLAVAGYVVTARRPDAPWARSFSFFLKLGLVVLVLRLVLQVIFGAGVPGRTVFSLPQVPVPDWATGLHIGGRVTAEGLVTALYDGLQLGVLFACIGAANALASPARLLKLVPGALYEAGVAVTVALSFAPSVVASVSRVRAARRLRGRPSGGLRGLRGLAVPVLEDALERSVTLAAAMDSRGFGRRGAVSAGSRRLTVGLTLAGLLALCAGVYGLLDASTPAVLGLPMLAAGTAVAGAGLLLGSRRAPRTRYRPDRWALPEWLVAGCGIAAAAALALAATQGVEGISPTTSPLVAPTLPLLPLIGVLAGMLPAWLAPPLPHPAGRR